METLTMDRQAFGKKASAVYGKSNLSETGEDQSCEHTHHFSLTSRELFIKNSSWKAKQSISHTTVMFHGECLKFSPEIWRQRNSLLHQDNTLSHTSFLGEFLARNNMTMSQPYLYICSIEDKAKRPPFWHNSRDGGRITQNTTSRMHLKHGRGAGKVTYFWLFPTLKIGLEGGTFCNHTGHETPGDSKRRLTSVLERVAGSSEQVWRRGLLWKWLDKRCLCPNVAVQ
jgi:hypothetical protein